FSSIFALITNPKFWIYGFCGAFYSAAFSLISQAIPFYVKYTLKKGGSTTTIMLGTVLVVAVIGIVIWSNIVKKWDIMKVWRCGFIIMAVSFIPLYFVNSFVGAVIIACIVGFGVAACLATMDCIGAKIVDDDFRRHGIKREGIISSLTGVMNRLNGLYTSLAFYFVSTKFGFVNGDNPGSDPALASRVLLCIFPAAAMIIASVITFFLHFDENNEKISDN
ncbi:MAG: MFS transporter, partial [Clostridia bacterium]|nr:MFS transporter [Clostridia bacterium]